MLSPSTDALRIGKALSAFTVAVTMNGMYVSLTPLRSWYGWLYFWRRWAARDMSISQTVVTCGETPWESTLCSAVFFRIGGIGSLSPRSPGWCGMPKGPGAGAGAARGPVRQAACVGAG